MTETLSHFTWQPTLAPYSVQQYDSPTMKPCGLWVSVDGPDDWPTWCAGEQFVDTDAQHRFRVEVADRAAILRLTTGEGLVDFAEQFGAPDRYGIADAIDWARVATRWQGIIIAPYQWSQRLEMLWYYGWDVASGCIWDASAIASVSEVFEHDLAVQR